MSAGVVLLVLALSAFAATPWQLQPSLSFGPVRRSPGRRRHRAGRSAARVDPAVVLDLAGAAIEAGASIPGALQALGDAIAGEDGPALARVASALLVGAPWSEAWQGSPRHFHGLRHALEPAWVDGVAAGALLAQAADRLRADQARAAEEAAARLSVRLVLPLGLCFLPSFVLLGLVPVVVAAARGLVG